MIRLACIAACALSLAIPHAAAQRMPYSRMDPVAAAALAALRDTDHWLAEAMSETFAPRPRTRDGDPLPPLGFDPSRHLEYLVVSVSEAGPPLVFLLFNWLSVRGSGPAPGVVMQQYGASPPYRWRVACDFADNDGTPYGAVTLLDRRSHGWRQFQIASVTYAWRPSATLRGAMDCVPVNPGAKPAR